MRYDACSHAVLDVTGNGGRLNNDIIEATLRGFIEVDHQGRILRSKSHQVLLQTYIKIIVCSMNNFNFNVLISITRPYQITYISNFSLIISL